MASNNIPLRLKRRHAQLALRRPASPSLLLNTITRPDQSEYSDASLFFGPGGSMFLPADPSDQAQFPQLIPPAASSQDDTTPPLEAPQVLSSASSANTNANSQTQAALTSASPSGLPTSNATPTFSVLPSTLFQTASPSLVSTFSTPPSNTPVSTASTAQAQSSIQTITAFVASPPTSTGTSQSPTISTTSGTIAGTLSQSGLPPSVPPASTSAALSSASSTQASTTHSESLPHLAEVVLGIVAAISVVAILATFGSWFYKQRKRRSDHAEIISLTSSAYEERPRGFFGCLKKRHSKSTDDMSELGFGLGHVGFFGAPNSGDEHHRVGLSLGPENVVRDDEHKYVYNDLGEERPLQPPRGLFATHGFTESSYPTARLLPVHLNAHTPAPADGERSISLSPSRYQHLNGTSVTPLTVANLLPGDVSGDEGGGEDGGLGYSAGGFLAPPPPAARYSSIGTSRTGGSAPHLTRLVEGDSPNVLWAPLNVRSRDTEEEHASEVRRFEPLSLSRTSTLSLALSRTFSRRLGHSLSKSADWRDGVTRPPRGTFRAAWDETAPAALQNGDVREPAEHGTWATTIRNNFYSALSAVGSMGAKGSVAHENQGSAATLPNPYSETSRQSSMRFPFTKPERPQEKLPEDIFTPPPAPAAQRSKGSIIRGKLGIEAPVHVGLGIDALSRSSTLSTSWSDAEKVPQNAWKTQHVRVLDREGPRAHLLRTGTESTASSSSDEAKTTFKQIGSRSRLTGRNLRTTNRRPRYSRMPMSQSSMWSSESYASSSANAKVEGKP